jgi:hypothetical protein
MFMILRASLVIKEGCKPVIWDRWSRKNSVEDEMELEMSFKYAYVCVCFMYVDLNEDLIVFMHACICSLCLCLFMYICMYMYTYMLVFPSSVSWKGPEFKYTSGIINITSIYIFVFTTFSHLKKLGLLRDMVHSKAGAG